MFYDIIDTWLDTIFKFYRIRKKNEFTSEPPLNDDPISILQKMEKWENRLGQLVSYVRISRGIVRAKTMKRPHDILSKIESNLSRPVITFAAERALFLRRPSEIVRKFIINTLH